MTAERGFDVLIERGTVVDGTGNPGFKAAVGIRAGRVELLRGSTEDLPARERVDATGRVVAPGFIDLHSHSDLVLLEDPHLEMKVRQGVTTEVIGVDGLSYTPFDDPADLAAFTEQNGGIAGAGSGPLTWTSLGEQLESYDERCAVNVASFVGNTALRVNAIGWEPDTADRTALDRMRGQLREAMGDGAFGLSTGLDYPPGGHATTDELTALATESANLGGIYHTHVRYGLGDTYLDPFREAADICRRAGSPLQVTHFSRSARATYTGGAQRMLDLIDQEREAGLDVTFDTYTYEWGGTRLSRLLPMWVQVGGPARLRERLMNPESRKAIADEVQNSAAARQYIASAAFSDLRLANLTHTELSRFEGWYLSEVVVNLGLPLGETVCRLVLGNPSATFARPSPHAMTLWKFVTHPLGMIASDSVFIGKAPSPRAYGCFTRVLADFVREERLLSLPEAVRKMTSFPAQRLGLSDRGILRDGAAADVVIFSMERSIAPASWEEPRRLAEGVDDVFVSGTAVLRDGVMTRALPGRALRGPAWNRGTALPVARPLEAPAQV